MSKEERKVNGDGNPRKPRSVEGVRRLLNHKRTVNPLEIQSIKKRLKTLNIKQEFDC
jgi:hypothetical protein